MANIGTPQHPSRSRFFPRPIKRVLAALRRDLCAARRLGISGDDERSARR
jgi:hypothetical protein